MTYLVFTKTTADDEYALIGVPEARSASYAISAHLGKDVRAAGNPRRGIFWADGEPERLYIARKNRCGFTVDELKVIFENHQLP